MPRASVSPVWAVVGSDYESSDVLRLYTTEARAQRVAARYERLVTYQRARYDAFDAERGSMFQRCYEQLQDMGFDATTAADLAYRLTEGEDSPWRITRQPHIPHWRWVSVETYTIHD